MTIRRIKIVTLLLLCIGLFFYGGLYLANYFFLQTKANKIIQEDCRNQGLVIKVRFDRLFDYKKLVFDVQAVGQPAGPLGLFRGFFQLANELKDYRFEQVVLAYKGVPRVNIDGDTFTKIGEQYGGARLVDLASLLGTHLRTMKGDRVFSTLPGHYASLLESNVHGGKTTLSEESAVQTLMESLADHNGNDS